MSITGNADGEPTKVGVALVDVLTGKDAVIGILAALADRIHTGLGQHVQVDLLSSLLGGLANQVSNYLTTGTVPTRMGNQHPSIAPYETFRCADAMLVVACGNDQQFRRLAQALGRPQLADDARFATNRERVAHRSELAEVLEVELNTAPAETWEKRLTAAGVPAGTVGDIGSAIARSEGLGLQPTIELGAGHARQIRHPIQYSRSKVAAAAPAPAIGEHNQFVDEWIDRGMHPLVRPAAATGRQ
jgi:formyl-CoA transferase